MTDLDKNLEMLNSPQASTRYDACEELRVATESSPEVILALEEATHDENEGVAERATQALLADVHHQMAIQMGKNLPIYEAKSKPAIESEPEKPEIENTKLRDFWKGFLIGLITFIVFGVLSVIYLTVVSPK
jgi:hypothetical protein